MAIKANLIGSGKLGSSLISALIQANIVELVGIYNRDRQHSLQAIEQIRQGIACTKLNELPAADLTWICVPDDQLALVAKSLSENTQLKPGSMAIHCSGVSSSAILDTLKNAQVTVASCHPLKSFAFPDYSGQSLAKTDCILEGDESVVNWLETQLPLTGASCHHIHSSQKATYHMAACIASNYLVTLTQAAYDLLMKTGLSAEQSQDLVLRLMQGTLSNMTQISPPAKALTGPIQRGDIGTIQQHLEKGQAGQWESIYRLLGKATANISGLDQKTQAELINLFTHRD